MFDIFAKLELVHFLISRWSFLSCYIYPSLFDEILQLTYQLLQDGYFISDKSFIALYWILHNLFPKKLIIGSI